MDVGSHSLPNAVFASKVPLVFSDIWKQFFGWKGRVCMREGTVIAKQLTDRGRQDAAFSASYRT